MDTRARESVEHDSATVTRENIPVNDDDHDEGVYGSANNLQELQRQIAQSEAENARLDEELQELKKVQDEKDNDKKIALYFHKLLGECRKTIDELQRQLEELTAKLEVKEQKHNKLCDTMRESDRIRPAVDGGVFQPDRATGYHAQEIECEQVSDNLGSVVDTFPRYGVHCTQIGQINPNSERPRHADVNHLHVQNGNLQTAKEKKKESRERYAVFALVGKRRQAPTLD